MEITEDTEGYTTIFSSKVHMSRECAEANTDEEAVGAPMEDIDHFQPCHRCIDISAWYDYLDSKQ